MKKVVVVTEQEKEWFEGENLAVYNKWCNPQQGVYADDSNVLVIQDDKKTIAVFNKWLYWKGW